MDLNLGRPLAFSLMAKPVGSTCNLSCTYCYYLEKEKLYPDPSSRRMTLPLAEKFIRQYIASQQTETVSFIWQGGEPAMAGIPFFENVIKWQQQYAGGKKIENAFQTNGTLLTDDWCRFLKTHDFLVGISADGPEFIHNQYRVNRDGMPSFVATMKGIELLKRYGIRFNTLTVVNRKSAEFPLEIYRFLKGIGSSFIQFLPVVEREASEDNDGGLRLVHHLYPGAARVTDWSVVPEDYGNFLIAIFDEWVRQDVGSVFVQLFDVTLANWVGEPPSLCVFSETCGNALVLEHNGDVFSCDHFVYPEYKLGNLNSDNLSNLCGSDRQIQFGLDKLLKLPPFCIRCEYRFACHGECPKHRFNRDPEGLPGLNYLCQAYLKFFTHVHPFMQFMGDELGAGRAPANVMQWIRQRDALQKLGSIKGRVPGRNEPCDCGSGRKSKHCCYKQKMG